MDNTAAKNEIDSLVSAMVSAWNAHDARAYVATLTQDADFTNVFGILVQGRAAIERSHAAIFHGMFKDSMLSATETRVRFLHPDIAVVDVRWEMVGARDPQGNEWPKRHGLLSAIATRGADGWLFAVFHNQDLPPPERMADIRRAMGQG
jgi:uncharacterized protein (TIGR02246 family)